MFCVLAKIGFAITGSVAVTLALHRAVTFGAVLGLCCASTCCI